MIDMREKGVRVDLDKADLVRKDLRSKVRDYKAEIKRKTGIEIEPWAGVLLWLRCLMKLSLRYIPLRQKQVKQILYQTV